MRLHDVFFLDEQVLQLFYVQFLLDSLNLGLFKQFFELFDFDLVNAFFLFFESYVVDFFF